ncbi:MAG: ABC transporter permease subunit, partial [Firmicutes bacterium]|nr:ABC transporter permease subunit [Bacillota bacterium]
MLVLEYSAQLLKQVYLLSTGALTTLRIFFLTLLFSLPLGLLIALARMAPQKWLNLPVRFFILIMRGTPLILQLIFFYFAPSAILPEGLRFTLPRFTAAVLA